MGDEMKMEKEMEIEIERDELVFVLLPLFIVFVVFI
jgi:hypothetical protein